MKVASVVVGVSSALFWNGVLAVQINCDFSQDEGAVGRIVEEEKTLAAIFSQAEAVVKKFFSWDDLVPPVLERQVSITMNLKNPKAPVPPTGKYATRNEDADFSIWVEASAREAFDKLSPGEQQNFKQNLQKTEFPDGIGKQLLGLQAAANRIKVDDHTKKNLIQWIKQDRSFGKDAEAEKELHRALQKVRGALVGAGNALWAKILQIEESSIGGVTPRSLMRKNWARASPEERKLMKEAALRAGFAPTRKKKRSRSGSRGGTKKQKTKGKA